MSSSGPYTIFASSPVANLTPREVPISRYPRYENRALPRSPTGRSATRNGADKVAVVVEGVIVTAYTPQLSLLPPRKNIEFLPEAAPTQFTAVIV